jgi:hypothetical protein
MNDISPLVQELSNPEYALLTDAEAAEKVNKKSVLIRNEVSTSVLKRWLIESGLWSAIRMAGIDQQSPREIRGVCLSIIDWVDDSSGKVQSVDLDRQSVVSMIDAIVDFGLATQSQASEFMALGNSTIPWTLHSGLPEVGIGLVINARKQMGSK